MPSPTTCHGGGSERKTAHHASNSPSRDTLCFECGVSRSAVADRSCSLFYPPLACGDGEHQHDVAAYRQRRDITSPEYLHELDPQPQIALIVADHGSTTEQQRPTGETEWPDMARHIESIAAPPDLPDGTALLFRCSAEGRACRMRAVLGQLTGDDRSQVPPCFPALLGYPFSRWSTTTACRGSSTRRRFGGS